MGLPFEAIRVDVDESASGAPDQAVLELARRKALAGAAAASGLILAADTLVALDGRALGKPQSRADAIAMLKSLRGRTHEVFTGVCLIDTESGRQLCRVDVTQVTFWMLNNEEIEAYVDGGEPMDKAGAYAIQGGAAAFVAAIEGSYTNVVGLPVELLTNMLAEMGM